MKICMVGTGYVGLVSGACFAETGQEVICADVDAGKIATLEAGGIPIFENGLEVLVKRNVAGGRLSFTSDVEAAIAESTAVYCAVGTPGRRDGGADLTSVDAVAQTVAANVTRETVLVLKSTVPVGTNARIRKLVADAKFPVHVVSNPEFLKEGDAVNDFLKPDRVVVGLDEDDAFARGVMERLYHPVAHGRADRIVWMDPASAELTKYVSNTMLAMRISFMNEVALLCEAVDADVHKVRAGVGSDSRIGPAFLYAGAGYGGSCFPKDVKALAHTARDHGLELELVATTDRVNDRQKGVVYRKLRRLFDNDLRGKRVAVWGLAFKPGTDDIREAPALTLIDSLLADGVEIVAHDPEATEQVRAVFGERITFVDNGYDAAKDADALCLMTEWSQYGNPNFDRLKDIMRRPLLIDGRNIWSTYGLPAQGFEYEGIGVR